MLVAEGYKSGEQCAICYLTLTNFPQVTLFQYITLRINSLVIRKEGFCPTSTKTRGINCFLIEFVLNELFKIQDKG